MKKMRISRINPNDPSYPHHKKPNFVAHENESPKTTSKSERQNFTTCDPKTSEYAFFKKLKKDASLSFMKPEFGDCSKERTDDVGVGTKGCNSSRIIQDVPTFKMDSFLSPFVGAWNKSGVC
uniref:Uncharacterized protein LOC101507380 n=1 Tax=Cicer arietinum TaxID=3827 RepID=A0A3Q7YF11_CICAR|nr:uncharacterized protein LOC101507380 [Cicer arietinum]XP_027189720.1 uncharacterized protein LOC101507380 [Cicer arietinum]